MLELAATYEAQVFAATHSAHILMGAVDAGHTLNIIRLTYENRIARARVLASDDVRKLMCDPLMRSSDVLSALFHHGAVVCEADSDRCFYQEINARILSAGSGGIKDSVFLNAQNKQTVRRIVAPLRKMGIAAATIVDFDIIKGSDLADLLADCCVPEAKRHSLTVLRGDIEQRFRSIGQDLGQVGVRGLAGHDLESCESLLSDLGQYGVFVVPNGQLESWLRQLEITARKAAWLTAVFERMGSEPNDPHYLRPGDADVWSFVRRIAAWVHNPARRGMPAA
jgi:hypothetical protein